MDSPYPGEQGIHVLEGPGDKSQKTFCVGGFFSLYFADADEMFHPFGQRFNMPEHHGSGRSDMEFMRFVHDVQPFLRPAFAFADKTANPVNEDLGSGAGERIHAGGSESGKDLVMAYLVESGYVGNFGWSESMKLKCRVKL